MTASARTVETNAADALAQLLYMLSDSDNLQHWVTDFEGSFPSPIIRADTLDTLRRANDGLYRPANVVQVVFEDGSVLHLTVTQIKEPNQ